MMLRKLAAAAATTLAMLTLAACGGDTEADEADGVFSSPTEIRDALADTDYECEWWDERDSENASCRVLLLRTETSQDVSRHWINFTETPELLAAVNMDDDPDNVGAVVGENWGFDCGADLRASQCEDVAAILGGEYVYRGYWS